MTRAFVKSDAWIAEQGRSKEGAPQQGATAGGGIEPDHFAKNFPKAQQAGREMARASRAQRLEEAYAKAALVVAEGRCPACGSALRRNSSMHGWWQCEQFGAAPFRARPEKPHCTFQTFTK